MTHLDQLHQEYCRAAALAENATGADARHFWTCADAAWDNYQKAKTDAELASREARRNQAERLAELVDEPTVAAARYIWRDYEEVA